MARRYGFPCARLHRTIAGDWQITLPRNSAFVPKHAAARSPETIALEALGWLLTDEARADRLLSLTGLTPDELRGGLGDRTLLAAVLDFLAGHEADLVAAAIALDLPPEDIAAASRVLAV